MRRFLDHSRPCVRRACVHCGHRSGACETHSDVDLPRERDEACVPPESNRRPPECIYPLCCKRKVAGGCIVTQQRFKVLVLGASMLGLPSVAWADDVLSAGFFLSIVGIYLVLTFGTGAAIGVLSSSRGVPAWRPLRYVVACLLLANIGLDASNPNYGPVLYIIPMAVLQTAFLAAPIAAAAFVMNARHARRASSPARAPAPGLSQRRLVLEAISLLCVAIALIAGIVYWNPALP